MKSAAMFSSRIKALKNNTSGLLCGTVVIAPQAYDKRKGETRGGTAGPAEGQHGCNEKRL